jgi:hypothetical protein
MAMMNSFLNGERYAPLTILSFSRTASGDRSGANLERGGEAVGSTGPPAVVRHPLLRVQAKMKSGILGVPKWPYATTCE